MAAEQLILDRHYTAWQLIKLYWQSNERVFAYLFFSMILFMTVLLVGFEVVFNYWYNYFYNALQAYDVRGVISLMFWFIAIAFFFIVIQVYRYYLSQMFALRWRRWLTDQLMNRWLAKRGYYYLENFDEKTDNPDQRIQEDAGTIVTNTIDLTVGLVSAVTTFPAFVYILWSLSGVLSIPLGSWGTLHIPGYLVWVSVLYNLIGTLIAFKIGRPLIQLNFEQQRREATFRHSAIDLRTHAEHVALYRGETHQKHVLVHYFKRVLQNWYAIILRQKKLLWFTGSYNQTAVLLPMVVALPNYFNRVFLLGGLIQSMRAFNSVQESLAFLVNSYTQIANWRAICRRLTTFINHLDDVEIAAAKADHLVRKEQEDNSINIENVTLRTPQNNILLKNIDEKLHSGKDYLIKGVSGIGKSTLVRAIAGIWPYAKGEILLPKNQRMLYLPQKPYMPKGTLEEAILFPNKNHSVSEPELKRILKDCHLDVLIPRLHDVAPWGEQLSPGEQQRVAFARILLQKPDWIFLDETTSMLDLKNEEYLYKLIKSRLPKCTMVSIGHRPSLAGLHSHVIDMEKYANKKM